MRLSQREIPNNNITLSKTNTTLVPTKIPMTTGSSVCEMNKSGIAAGKTNNMALAASVFLFNPPG